MTCMTPTIKPIQAALSSKLTALTLAILSSTALSRPINAASDTTVQSIQHTARKTIQKDKQAKASCPVTPPSDGCEDIQYPKVLSAFGGNFQSYASWLNGPGSLRSDNALRFFEGDPTTTSLDLSYNNLGPSEAGSLAAVLSVGRLACLNLSHNGIGDTGMEFLALGFGDGRLISLNLGFNKISAVGAQSLVKIILQNPFLVTLYLQYNELRDSGAEALAAVVSKSQLTTLNLSSNGIGAPGAEYLSKALPRGLLTSLDLGNNAIDTIGAESLLAVLGKSQLTMVNLDGNTVDPVLKNRIAEQITQNSKREKPRPLLIRSDTLDEMEQKNEEIERTRKEIERKDKELLEIAARKKSDLIKDQETARAQQKKLKEEQDAGLMECELRQKKMAELYELQKKQNEDLGRVDCVRSSIGGHKESDSVALGALEKLQQSVDGIKQGMDRIEDKTNRVMDVTATTLAWNMS